MINEAIKKNGVTYGIALGVILALITATMYSIDLKLFVSNWTGPSIFVINLIVGITLLVKTKKDLNGSFSFKEAFTTYFIAILAALLISTLFSILLFNIIDPEAKETISEYLIKYMAEMLQKFGTPASAVNEALAKMRETNPFSTLEQLKGLVFSLALYSILGLILAAFFKSKTTKE